MRRRIALVVIALQAAACLAACQPSVPTGATSKPAPRATRPKDPGAGATIFPPLGEQGGGVISNNGGGVGGQGPSQGAPPASPLPLASLAPSLPGVGIVANNGAALTGKVKAPAGLIGNNGGALIGNNGGGLIGNNSAGIVANNGGGAIANNGAAYSLLAGLPEQVPVGDTAVGLVDATGALVRDAQGRAMVTRTAADGSYTFAGAPTDRPLFVLVDLPAGHGQLAAFAGASAAAAEAATGTAPPPRTVDLDLVSTLTTGYIYNQYVAWQPDPAATIAKLPSDVEATTRAKAAEAFATSGGAVPDRLGPAEVQGTIARMRVVDDAFDAQMEAVRKLLVVAGQTDLGNGRPATEVQLTPIWALGFGPDGRLYMNALVEQRIWRLTPEGVLENAAGATKLDRGELTGVAGPEAGLAQMFAFGFDGFGRLLLPEAGNLQRLSRLEPDGRLTELWRPGKPLQAVWPGAGGEVLALAGGELVSITQPGQVPQVLHTFSTADAAKLNLPSAFGRGADGKLLIRASNEGEPRVYRFDLGTKVLDPAKGALGLAREPMLDANGRLYDYDPATRAIALVGADGKMAPLGTLPRDLYQQAVTLGPDGAVYLAAAYQVYKLVGSELTVVAGIPDGGQAGGNAGDLSLAAPAGLMPEADGAVLVADKLAHRVWRVKPDRTVVPFAGTGGFGQTGDGGPAADAQIASPQDLARDGAGNLYVLTPSGIKENAVRKIAPDGTITTVAKAPVGGSFAELEVAPDGTIYTAIGQSVLRIPAGQAEATILHTEPTVPNGNPILYALALDAAGTLHWAVTGSLQKWSEASGVQVVKQDRERILGVLYGGLALDAKGRYYVASFALHTIERFDPAGGTWTKIAGPGAPLLAGTSPADSLKNPTSLAFDANGDLLVADEGHKQVKRLAAATLPQ